MTDAIYTIPEVARYLKHSKSKVYYMVQQGAIPHIRIGKNVRIQEQQLREWMDGRWLDMRGRSQSR